MTREEIFSRVVVVVAEEFGRELTEVKEELRFSEDLGADSLDAVEVVMKLEEVFGIEIPDEEAEPLLTVKAVVDYLDRKFGTAVSAEAGTPPAAS